MEKVLVQCDLCVQAFRSEPPDTYCPSDPVWKSPKDIGWESLEGSDGQFDICPSCQNIIAQAHYRGVLDQIVEVIKG